MRRADCSCAPETLTLCSLELRRMSAEELLLLPLLLMAAEVGSLQLLALRLERLLIESGCPI